MNPKEYLRLSWQILNNPETSHEAGYRSVTSRAYYAAFNVCCCILNKYFPIPKTGTAHERVQKLLNNSENKQLEYISLKLKNLMFYRKKADYDNECIKHTSKNVALVNLKIATEIISIIEFEFSRSEKDQIVNSISEYLRKTNNQ